MNMHVLVLAHTCAHACIVAHMNLYIIVMAYSHTHKYTVHLHIPDGYTCMMWHTINKSVTDAGVAEAIQYWSGLGVAINFFLY